MYISGLIPQVLLIFKYGRVLIGILEQFDYIFYDIYSYELYKGKLLFKILVFQFKHITKKDKWNGIKPSISQLGFLNRRCIKSPQSVM